MKPAKYDKGNKMSRSFDLDKLPLPSSDQSMDELISFYKNYGHCIKGFKGNHFIDSEKQKSIPVEINSMKLTMNDCGDVIRDAMNSTKSYKHLEEEYKNFLRRFRDILFDRLSMLLNCASAVLQLDFRCFGSDEEELIKNAVNKSFKEDLFQNLFANHWSNSNIYRITDNEPDLLFHILRVLQMICKPRGVSLNTGILVICESPIVATIMFMLTTMINEAAPPENIFSFLPIASNGSKTTSIIGDLTIIFHSADLDTAVRNFVCSLAAYGGTGKWKSPIILVEESAKDRLVLKLKKHMNSNERLKPYFRIPEHTWKALHLKIEEMSSAFSAELIQPQCDNGNIGPLVLDGVPPTSLSVDVANDFGPLGFLVTFRTAKEAVSLSTHFLNQCMFSADNVFTENVPMYCVNIWLESAGLAWQLTSRFAQAGFENIFINAGYKQRMRKMYENMMFSAEYDPIFNCTKEITAKYSALTATITKQLSLALTTQNGLTRSKQNIENIISTMQAEFANEYQACVTLMKGFFIQCNDLSENKDPLGFPQLNKDVDHLLLSHRWLTPRGPIVLPIFENEVDDNSSASVLHSILLGLCSGNTLLFLRIKGKVELKLEIENTFKLIEQFSKSVNPSNTVSMVTLDSISKSDMLQVLSSIRHPCSVIDIHSPYLSTQYLLTAPYRYLKPCSMYWSTGNELFAN